jgi:hypothetical protein
MLVYTRLKQLLRIINDACGIYVNALCVYLLCENAKLYYLYIEVIQSALMCYIPKFLRKKYIPLLNLNSDDVVMSRGNRNFLLTHICKRRDVTNLN